MNKISKFNPEEVVIKVKPKDKNSAKLLVKIFHKNENDKRVEIIETFRWGVGYIEGSIFFNKGYKLNKHHIVCNPDVGDGNDLDDLFSIDFNYEGHWNDEEKNEFEKIWQEGDPNDPDLKTSTAWLYECQNEWEISSIDIVIDTPVQLSVVEKFNNKKVIIDDYQD